MVAELLRQVRVLNPQWGTDQIADVLIVDGMIGAIQPQITDWPRETQVQDCQGWVLGPGLWDLYSHGGEPGFEERETLASLLAAAQAGGFTRITLLPDTDPAVDNPAVLSLFSQKLSRNPAQNCQLQVWGALTQGVGGTRMTELGELAESNIVGFADGQPIQDLVLLRRILEYLNPLNKPIALACGDRTLAGNGVIREGKDAICSGLPGIPVYAETAALGAILELVAGTQTPVHLMGISTARSVELIQAAKARQLPITASTTWMHLLLNTEAISGFPGGEFVGESREEPPRAPAQASETTPFNFIPTPYDPSLRLDPPLGTPTDQRVLIQAVATGIIDAIAVNHTPYTYEEKTVAFADAPPGAIGLELVLPLLWQELVTSRQWSALTLWQALSLKPAHCLGQSLPEMAPGQPAELTLFNPQQPWTITPQTLNSRASNTPWLGQPLMGQVVKTWSISS
ncbi:MAG: dihydroorotase [Oscillatoriales cyanobacterium RM2_1_1]|nr:dihydroorotase [Oscillatoriales cyanobacterium SM2_3_0]NJO45590.1 dihydroorotase [Oscillatoriales cyanobacterium RM2_1_1]